VSDRDPMLHAHPFPPVSVGRLYDARDRWGKGTSPLATPASANVARRLRALVGSSSRLVATTPMYAARVFLAPGKTARGTLPDP
jgi:hypothetical protein